MQVVCPACLVANRVPPNRLADRPVCGKCRAALSPQQPIVLADATFDRYIGASDVPVLVDFWAEWCGPCRSMNPILHAIAHDRQDLRVAKVNTDTEAGLAQRFNIRSIPLLVLMRRGAELGRLTGALPATQLSAWLEATLRQAPPANKS
jgi:thioredoxin 2